MKLKTTTYELRDVAIVQAPVSYCEHRGDVDNKVTICDRDVYPVFVSPMASVTDENNYKVWIENGLTPVVPRSVQQSLTFEERMKIATETFVSISLSEAKNEFMGYLFTTTLQKNNEVNDNKKLYICIDIAHGTLESLYNICKLIKDKYGDRVVIMTGNVANPSTYQFYADAGVDYCRIGIGTGCFTPYMCVVTKDGLKKICEIQIGDEVLTHTGEFHKVTHTHEYQKNEKLLRINNIECTSNHLFYVVNKNDAGKITVHNLQKYAYWVQASELDKKKHLLVLKTENMLKLLEIETIEYFDYNGKVYDLTVDVDETYNINGVIVHNSRCTSSANVGVHYGLATLIDQLNEQRKAYAHSHNGYAPTKLIVDGGISNFDDINKSIALGADAVMCGNLIARSEEACGPIYELNGERVRDYYGMSTKRAQRITGGNGDRTSEGIDRPIKIEYPIAKWVDNMQSYLRSAMTYTNSRTIKEMQENAQVIILGGSGDLAYRK